MEPRLEGLTGAAGRIVGSFLANMTDSLRGGLHAMVVAGDATSPSFEPGSSTISVTLLLESMPANLFQDVGAAWKPLARKGLEPPLLMTATELYASLDTYPVEMLALKLTGTVVWGEFKLESMAIEPGDLRLQCERELRGLLLHSRMAAVRFGESEPELGQLLASGSARLLTLLRAVVHLLGGEGRGDESRVTGQLADLADLDTTVLGEILGLRRRARPRMAGSRVLALADTLAALAELVDRFDTSESEGET